MSHRIHTPALASPSLPVLGLATLVLGAFKLTHTLDAPWSVVALPVLGSVAHGCARHWWSLRSTVAHPSSRASRASHLSSHHS
jgi:hypothetical protein